MATTFLLVVTNVLILAVLTMPPILQEILMSSNTMAACIRQLRRQTGRASGRRSQNSKHLPRKGRSRKKGVFTDNGPGRRSPTKPSGRRNRTILAFASHRRFPNHRDQLTQQQSVGAMILADLVMCVLRLRTWTGRVNQRFFCDREGLPRNRHIHGSTILPSL